MDFSKRHREDELMDDESVSIDALKRIYDDIDRANSFLGGTNGLIKAVSNLIEENPKEAYVLLDVGCGNGAMLRDLCLFFRSKKLKVTLIGIDINTNAIALAKIDSVEFPEISYLELDILNQGTELPVADFVVSCLTLHHIEAESVPLFLGQMGKMGRIGIVISDLQRSRLAYYLFKFFSAIFIKTKVAKNDGLVSIRSGFTKKELCQFSMSLPKYQHSIKWKWAFRYVWAMRIKRPIDHE